MKIGLACGRMIAAYGFDKAFEMLKKSGFDAVDIGVERWILELDSAFSGSEDDLMEYFDNMRKSAENYELEISQTHSVNTTTVPDPILQEQLKKRSEIAIKATDILKAPTCIFHSTKIREWEDVNTEPEFLLKKNKEFFDGFLSPICEKYNVKFALETHGRSRLKDGNKVMDFIGDANNLKKSYDSLDSAYKTICLDTGHTNEIVCFGAPTVPETIRILGKDITTLHLHDNAGNTDSHLPPFLLTEGSVNWEETFDALDEIGYSGVYNWEIEVFRYGKPTQEGLDFLGKNLKYFINNKGRVNK